MAKVIKGFPNLDAWYSMFSDSANFFSTSNSMNILICRNNTVWKVDEIISESEIILTDTARRTKWKTWQPGRPREICQNREPPSSIGRVGGSVIIKRLVSFWRGKHGQKVHRQNIYSSLDIYPKQNLKRLQLHLQSCYLRVLRCNGK